MAIQVASTHQTKHIAIHIHHLRHVIDLVYISTKTQHYLIRLCYTSGYLIRYSTYGAFERVSTRGFKISMYKDDTADMREQHSDFSDGLLHGFSE